MSKRTVFITAAVIVIPVLAVAWWLGSPLFLDTEVDEEFPMAARAVIPDDMTPEQVEAEMEEAASQPDIPVGEEMPEAQSPMALAGGSFVGFDDFHQGAGTATIYRLEDGSHVLRLEDFEVTNGPDLHVLLVPDADPMSRDEITGYIDLGPLKGNIGAQNYEIRAGVDPARYGSVVIYCQPFHVIFATASLG